MKNCIFVKFVLFSINVNKHISISCELNLYFECRVFPCFEMHKRFFGRYARFCMHCIKCILGKLAKTGNVNSFGNGPRIDVLPRGGQLQVCTIKCAQARYYESKYLIV